MLAGAPGPLLWGPLWPLELGPSTASRRSRGPPPAPQLSAQLRSSARICALLAQLWYSRIMKEMQWAHRTGKVGGSVAVQVNGKTVCSCFPVASQREAEKLALSKPELQREIAGRSVLRVIFVAGHLINFVVCE